MQNFLKSLLHAFLQPATVFFRFLLRYFLKFFYSKPLFFVFDILFSIQTAVFTKKNGSSRFYGGGDDPLSDCLWMPHGSEEAVLFEAAVQASSPWPK